MGYVFPNCPRVRETSIRHVQEWKDANNRFAVILDGEIIWTGFWKDLFWPRTSLLDLFTKGSPKILTLCFFPQDKMVIEEFFKAVNDTIVSHQ
jgi:hypothetical protein